MPFCSKDFRDKLPALVNYSLIKIFTEPNLNSYNSVTGEVNEAKQHQYSGSLNEKALFDFAQ